MWALLLDYVPNNIEQTLETCTDKQQLIHNLMTQLGLVLLRQAALGIQHGDLHTENLLLDSNQNLVVID